MYRLFTHETPVALMDLPYSVHDHDGHRIVILHRDAPEHPAITNDVGSAILAPGVDEIRIDCSTIAQANSVLIAWIIRVVNGAKPRKVALINVSERQGVLFRRMRLDQLVDIR